MHLSPVRPTRRGRAPAGRRAQAAAALVIAGSLGAAGCGSSSQPAANRSTTTPAATGSTRPAATGRCAGAGESQRAAVVVQPAAGQVVERCVSFRGTSIGAASALAKSGIEEGVQRYSFGLAVCQLDGVPAHYSSCLPSGRPYWALFVSRQGRPWTSASAGLSDVTLSDGDAVGFRYDPPQGTPSPPTKLPTLR